MSTILYFDCFSGISGDMVLGAFLDLGLPLEGLQHALGSLAVEAFEITATRVLRAGVSATKFDLVERKGEAHGHAHAHDHAHAHSHDHSHGHDHPHTHAADPGQPHTHGDPAGPTHSHAGHPHRSLPDIFGLIDRSALGPSGRERARQMFRRLAEAEAAIHQMPVEQVHLHEVGALDSIIDIVGAVYALEWAGVDRIVCSPLNVGGGMVDSAHGRFPVPAPATLRLLEGAPVYSGTVQRELVTPTGALVATTYASSFGPMPAMRVDKVGYGAGSADPQGTPNVLRIVVGRAADDTPGDRVVVIECEIDDMNPQIFGSVMDSLYAAGALEVFYVPVQMKKNRPGTLLTVIAPPGKRQTMTDIVFRETTTIGLRHHEVERQCLAREIVTVETPIGPVRFKLASHGGHIVNAAPEFEDCARLAAEHGRPVKDVQAIAVQAYGARQERPL